MNYGGPVARRSRLLLSEYVKYVAAEVRVHLADAGLDLTPELAGPTRWIAAAQTGYGSSQLIGFSMISIFLRSLVYNVLFYLLLVFWMLVGIPTYADAALGHHEHCQILGA